MEKYIFKRKLYAKMLEWKAEGGRTALLIKGARRVGKSTVVEDFAHREYKSYLLIDFSLADEAVRKLFFHLSNLDAFFLGLQTLTGVTLYERKSVIVFDEVQLFPPARQAIKHLVKDGRYDYIETGSLLSIKKNVKDIVIPSEETRLSLYPLDYEEFLWATGKTATYEGLRVAFENRQSLGDAANRSLMRDFRVYMLVGGMPQAVASFLDTNDFAAVDKVKRNILELYTDDFRKIDPQGRASRLFNSIPMELSRHTTRYKVGSVISNATAARLSEILMDMEDSMTVNFAYNATDPSVGLSMHANPELFKMYLADTGLFVTLAYMDKDYSENTLYRKLMFDKLNTDLGYIYENMVAQMLRSSGNELYYHVFKERAVDGAKKEQTYEVDFLISRKDKLCPIEVKSSSYRSHKSLDRFQTKYSQRILQRYLIYAKDLRQEEDIVCLPIYMTAFL